MNKSDIVVEIPTELLIAIKQVFKAADTQKKSEMYLDNSREFFTHQYIITNYQEHDTGATARGYVTRREP